MLAIAVATVLISVSGGRALAATPPPPRVYFIGDSWSSGLHADPQHTLAQDAAEDLHWKATVNAVSGTGYLHGVSQHASYPQRVGAISSRIRADIFIVQGGSNDQSATASALSIALRRTVTGLRARFPDRPVIILGPGPDPWPLNSRQVAVDRTLRTEARRLNTPYISMLSEHWITAGNVNRVISASNHHPTVSGDRYLGGRLAADLRRMRLRLS